MSRGEPEFDSCVEVVLMIVARGVLLYIQSQSLVVLWNNKVGHMRTLTLL